MGYDYQTSLPAYEEAKKNIGTKQNIVLSAIEHLGTCTDVEIAQYLSWPINRVTPRRGELLSKNLIMLKGKYPDTGTNRMVNHWQSVKQLKN